VLPTELAACEETQVRVVASELDTCAVTGKRVLKERLVYSAVSGRPVLPAHAVYSILSRKPALPAEIVFCLWHDGPILQSEAGVCRLTGCTVDKALLNEDGELQVLRILLNGRAQVPGSYPDLAQWLRHKVGGGLRNLTGAVGVPAPSGAVVALCAEARSYLFWTKHVGALVQIRGERSVLGRISIGVRRGGQWFSEE
jgi:hypothetical protein